MSYIVKKAGSSPKYTAWAGKEEDYPHNRLIGCFYTLRAAKKACLRTDEGTDRVTAWRSYEDDAMRKRIAELEKELNIR